MKRRGPLATPCKPNRVQILVKKIGSGGNPTSAATTRVIIFFCLGVCVLGVVTHTSDNKYK
jgi:hypothetical protein